MGAGIECCSEWRFWVLGRKSSLRHVIGDNKTGRQIKHPKRRTGGEEGGVLMYAWSQGHTAVVFEVTLAF